MDWSQVLAIIGSNMAVFLWARAESKNDTRMMLGIIDGIQKEIKDFHSRLGIDEEKELSESIDSRLTRLEGRIEERGYWQSQNKNRQRYRKERI